MIQQVPLIESAEAICQPNTLLKLPPLELDDMDSFLIAIEHNLRKL